MNIHPNSDKVKYEKVSCLSDYLGSKFLQTDRQLFFRGLPKETHKLIPSLFRLKPERLVSDWSFYEFEILTKFQKAASPHLKFLPVHFLEWLTIAQHYGVPTRLLDWTMSPLAALYFALEKHIEEDISENAIVWILDSKGEELVHDASYTRFTEWQKWYAEEKFSNTCIYHPTHLAIRVNSQQGCFTIPLITGKTSVQ
ncbi:MAG TPA: FRG domain-containing protein [Candidatus Altiarchaeales archaeon]|nr:FRG domain-containing protein [Candidatus Altiarchaeales archaeon]